MNHIHAAAVRLILISKKPDDADIMYKLRRTRRNKHLNKKPGEDFSGNWLKLNRAKDILYLVDPEESHKVTCPICIKFMKSIGL